MLTCPLSYAMTYDALRPQPQGKAVRYLVRLPSVLDCLTQQLLFLLHRRLWYRVQYCDSGCDASVRLLSRCRPRGDCSPDSPPIGWLPPPRRPIGRPAPQIVPRTGRLGRGCRTTLFCSALLGCPNKIENLNSNMKKYIKKIQIKKQIKFYCSNKSSKHTIFVNGGAGFQTILLIPLSDGAE